jgi:peptidoglycan hydrolase-like protein with peptidoglycan-binding domain
MPLVALRFANNQQLQAAARNSPPLKHGTTGKAVELLQRSLIELGFGMPVSTDKNTNVPDGIYGNETARTVRSFASSAEFVG